MMNKNYYNYNNNNNNNKSFLLECEIQNAFFLFHMILIKFVEGSMMVSSFIIAV
jgi:hypothetical protein